MPVTTSYPGLYIQELASASHTITAAPTSIAVFVGYSHPFKTNSALYGSAGSAIPGAIPFEIFSFSDFERQFGGFFESDYLSSDLPDAVSQFFLNGGAVAYVVALQPKYHDATGVNPDEDFDAATLTVGNILFTAIEPTDANHVMAITINHIPPTDNTTADITITYGTKSETFRKVSLDPTKPNFINTVVGTAANFVSSLVTVSPAVAGPYGTFSTPISRAPMLWTPPTFPVVTTFLASDFTRNFQADTPLDKLSIFNLMVLPGVADAETWAEAAAFCEHKYAFLILDPPANTSADGMAGLGLIEDFMTGGAVPESRNAAIYFPYLQSFDAITGNPINRPPGGFVAGIFARTDQNRGVWKAPAGLEATINNTTGVVDTGMMSNGRQGVLNNLGVNAIRQFPGSGTVVFGARTVVSANVSYEQWKYVPVPQMALFIEQTLLANLGWVIFEPNDEPLWIAIRTSIEAFMLGLFRQQAFQGDTPSVAFKVTCDSTTTTSADQDNGIVNIVVAFAPLKPAEFVVIQIASWRANRRNEPLKRSGEFICEPAPS